MTRGQRIRRTIASLASVVPTALAIRELARSHHFHLGGGAALYGVSILAVPVVASVLVWSPRLAAQLLARGVWWSMLLMGALASVVGGGGEPGRMACYIALSSATALLAVGTRAGTKAQGQIGRAHV